VSEPDEAHGRWPERRFSQAISEGDGISVIPFVRGDAESFAGLAEAAGAEALAVETIGQAAALREKTDLPLLLHGPVADLESLRAARAAGVDACVLVYEALEGDEALLEELVAEAVELGLDWALDVRDEDELEEALERLDPDIVVLSERDREKDEVELELTLDLLPDVPAGKLVVSDSGVTTREQVLELERAGVDAVLVPLITGSNTVSTLLARLTGHAS
jgi:indole-3-glycerol phosphate synthase